MHLSRDVKLSPKLIGPSAKCQTVHLNLQNEGVRGHTARAKWKIHNTYTEFREGPVMWDTQTGSVHTHRQRRFVCSLAELQADKMERESRSVGEEEERQWSRQRESDREQSIMVQNISRLSHKDLLWHVLGNRHVYHLPKRQIRRMTFKSIWPVYTSFCLILGSNPNAIQTYCHTLYTAR